MLGPYLIQVQLVGGASRVWVEPANDSSPLCSTMPAWLKAHVGEAGGKAGSVRPVRRRCNVNDSSSSLRCGSAEALLTL